MKSIPFRIFFRDHPPGEGSQRHGVEWSLLLLFLLLAAGITLAGIYYLKHRQEEARSAAQAELVAIADLKIQQIVNWRKERMADANLIQATPYVARRALDALARPDSATTRKMFTGWLNPLLAGGVYSRALILDDQLNIRFVHPEGALPTLAEAVRGPAEAALRTRQVVWTGLHQAADDGHVHLGLLVPLVVRREGTNDNVLAAGLEPSPADRSVGLLLLQINARDFLFPLIQTWPTPSRTAETLLVRREGDDVLFLNELRHQSGTAMTLRHPLEEAQLPAAKGVRGETGIQEGVDYRGVRVVAVVRAVPDTAWLMVAKEDEAEIYAPLRQNALTVVVVALALLLAAVLGVAMLWRRRSEHFLRAQLASEQERRVLAERFEHLMRHASEIVLLTDAQWRIVEANIRAEQTYGWTLAELQRQTLPDLRPPESRADFARQLEPLGRGEPVLFETVHRRKDGTVFPAEVSACAVEIGGVSYRLDLVRDITQRKAHEAEIERLNRLYATLSQINQVITRLNSREELFQAVCRIVAEYGRFKVVWIGWLNRETGAVIPMARAGDDEGYVDQIKVYADDRPEGRGPVGTCIRHGQPSIFNDFVNDSRALPWHGAALAHGLRSVAAMPVRYRGEVCGALAVYAEQPNVFQDKEVALLEEAALDISFALDHLEGEAQRRQARSGLAATRSFQPRPSSIIFLWGSP